MGAPKLFLPVPGGGSVLEEVRLAAAPLPLLAVTNGELYGYLRAVIPRVLVNREAPSEQLDSLRIGLAQAERGGARAALIFLSDNPGDLVRRADVLLRVATPDQIHLAAHDGRPGHPMLIPSRFWQEIRTTQFTDGLRGYLAALPPERITQHEAGPEALHDLDTPSDYHSFLRTSPRP
jgi:molybdenum cofactor cytidylyltransferase